MLLGRSLIRILALTLFFLSFCFCPVFAQTGTVASTQQGLVRTIKLPLEQWLEQGERTEIPWKVSLSHPVLTYQLRNLVRVTAEVPVDVLQKQGILHDLHFIVKVAPEHGAWDAEESYSRFRVEAKLDPRSELQMMAELYLRSGVYTIATIAYDATSEKRNLSLTRIQIGEADHDPFPDLLGAVPKIQFLAPPDDAAPLGAGRISLPVATQRPVQLDLILDLSSRQEEGEDTDDVGLFRRGYRPYSSGELRARRDLDKRPHPEIYEQSLLLQTASLLSKMSLKQGCIRVAVFDILGQRTILPFISAAQVNWDKMRDGILSSDRAMVSVAGLKGRRDAAKFFEHQLEQTMVQPPQCSPDASTSLHVIVILSRGITFPSGSEKPRMQPECNCRIAYLQQDDRAGYGGSDLRNLLKPLSPVTLEFADPQDFRQKLFEFTRTLEQLP